MRWRVILPVKPQNEAKTRLRTATPSSARHAELVRAIQLDTLAAVLATRADLETAGRAHRADATGQSNGRTRQTSELVQIAGVHIVGDADLISIVGDADLISTVGDADLISTADLIGDHGVHVIRDPGSGLNAALAETAQLLMRQWPTDGVIAMVADLPALRPAELREVLVNASKVVRGLVIDAAGSGTTMLTARPGQLLRPEFGADSAARHQASGAAPLAAGPGARTDVDTAADLQSCLRLGVGEHTASMVAYLV